MALEMQIYNPTESGYVTEIKWNYEEIRDEVMAQSESYATAVYTDDLIKQAKSDRAKLNKFVKALKDRRTEVRKKLLAPDEAFGKQVDEIVGIVQKAITNIDTQVKSYEEKCRTEKMEKIRAEYVRMISEADHLREVLPFERVWVPEWANASFTMKKAVELMAETFKTVQNGLDIIDSSDSPYAGDMKKVFLQTFDIGKAMERRNQLEEEAKRRAAYEEERRRQQEERDRTAAEEARKQASLGLNKEPAGSPLKQGIDAVIDKPVPEPKSWIAFEALLDTHHAALLGAFFKNNGIEYRSIKKEA